MFVSCEKSGDSKAAADVTGAGGSLSRFTIAGNYLYAVSSHYVYTVNISNPAQPVKTSESPLNFDMETIYAYRDRLYIGSRTGLYVYSLATPDKPKLIGEARHGRSCDPVVANDSVSYSTLKGSTSCGPATSGLYVYDVKTWITRCSKKRSRSMSRSGWASAILPCMFALLPED